MEDEVGHAPDPRWSGHAFRPLITLAELLVPTCDQVGLIVSTPDGRSGAAVEPVHSADAWQLASDEGPSLDVLAGATFIASADLAVEPRWPRWSGRVAAELSFRSVASVELTAPDWCRRVVLTLYSRRPRALDRSQLERVAALALAHRRTDLPPRRPGLDDPTLLAPTTIAVGVGVVMSRERLPMDEAVLWLEREARDTGRSVHDTALALVRSLKA